MRAVRIRETFDPESRTWHPVEEDAAVRCYDDGPGPLWAAVDTFGIVAFLRGPRTWEDAWYLSEDVAWYDARWEDVADCLVGEPGYPTREAVAAAFNGPNPPDLPEGFGWRPNGPGSPTLQPGCSEPLYQLDLNGHDVVRVTREFLAEHHVRVVIP